MARDPEAIQRANRAYRERNRAQINERTRERKRKESEKERAAKVKAYTGRRFGALTTLALLEPSLVKGAGLWLCQCDCGQQAQVRSVKLNFGKTTSCGCGAGRSAKARKDAQFIGKKFGKLTVMERGEKCKDRQYMWRCRCECGMDVFRRLDALAHSKHQSCYNCGSIRYGPTGPRNKGFSLDLVTNRVRMKRHTIELTAAGIRFLKVLSAKHPEVATEDDFVAAMWPDNEPDNLKGSLAAYAHQVRLPLRTIGVAIQNVYGVGYKMVLPDDVMPRV